jgi:hypothetical protein
MSAADQRIITIQSIAGRKSRALTIITIKAIITLTIIRSYTISVAGTNERIQSIIRSADINPTTTNAIESVIAITLAISKRGADSASVANIGIEARNTSTGRERITLSFTPSPMRTLVTEASVLGYTITVNTAEIATIRWRRYRKTTIAVPYMC